MERNLTKLLYSNSLKLLTKFETGYSKKNPCKPHKPNKWLMNFLNGLIWVTSKVIIVALISLWSLPVRKKYLWFQNLEQAMLTWKNVDWKFCSYLLSNKKINWPWGYNFRRVMGLKLDWASEGEEVSQGTILIDHGCLNFVGLVPQRGFWSACYIGLLFVPILQLEWETFWCSAQKSIGPGFEIVWLE